MSGNFLAANLNEKPILQQYPLYGRVFVALHPFVHVQGLSPDKTFYAKDDHFQAADINGLMSYDVVNELLGPTPQPYAAWEVDRAQKEKGKAVRWRKVYQDMGLEHYGRLGVMLLQSIGLFQESGGAAGSVEKLSAYLQKESLFAPTAGFFQPIMERAFAKLFAQAGALDIICDDDENVVEHPNVLKLDMLSGEKCLAEHQQLYSARKLYTWDRTVMAVVPVNCFFSLILLRDNLISTQKIESLFEGFWADKNTKYLWFDQKLQPLRGPIVER